jgi:hypothetical protein
MIKTIIFILSILAAVAYGYNLNNPQTVRDVEILVQGKTLHQQKIDTRRIEICNELVDHLYWFAIGEVYGGDTEELNKFAAENIVKGEMISC